MLFTCLAAALAAAIVAPVTHVTVYSDRARVVRSAEVELQGPKTIELPLLDESVDASTIQLEASGGQVQKIDIARVTEEDFPRDEAQELLLKLEHLDDRLLEINGQRNARQKQLQALRNLRPSVKIDDVMRPPPKLSSEGWAAAISFVDEQTDKLQAGQRTSNEALIDLQREREKLAHRASQLGGARMRSGHKVRATMSGQGVARLKLTYMAMRARWFPAYDVQFLADKGQVNIAFAGQVSQETGEDWVDASVTLSTAVPSTSRQMPKLLSWKIGERERFIPTPAPQQVQPPPPPPPVPQPLPRPEQFRRAADNQLRQKLASRAASPPQMAEPQPDQPEETIATDLDAAGVEGGVVGGVVGHGRGAAMPAPQAMPSAPPPPPPPPWRRDRQRAKKAAPKPAPPRSYEQSMPAEAPSAKAEAMQEMVVTGELRKPGAAPTPAAQVGLAPPPAYVPPSWSAELPAALAGGYDLVFPALRKETIKTGEGLRRVPLLSESWPVKADRVVYPALAPEAAFLVAEIKNPSARVLPGGPAALAVGADPAGQAQLKLVSPGETFTLPLGLDRNIKPIRNVNLSTAEKGFIGKDELTHYTVTIELANPYRTVIPIRVVDQVPVKANKEAELKLESATPAPAKHDKDTGELQWDLQMPASGKSTVTFVYSLRRPKGYRLYQEQ